MGRPAILGVAGARPVGTLGRMETTRAIGLTEGTRDELLAELHRLKEGWEHFGNDRLAGEAGQAIDALTLGASSVRVGHTAYDVTETPDTGMVQ